MPTSPREWAELQRLRTENAQLREALNTAADVVRGQPTARTAFRRRRC